MRKNRYLDIAHMPEHVKGHPSRMSHEFGVRLLGLILVMPGITKWESCGSSISFLENPGLYWKSRDKNQTCILIDCGNML